MVHFEFSETINRPPEEVFTYLTDPGKLTLWQGGVSEAYQETDGPMDVGTRVTEVRGLLGRRMESTLEITTFEPTRRVDFKVIKGPVPYSVRHTLEPSDGGTRISGVVEGEPGGFFKLAEPLVARAAERQVKADLATLKDLLEAE
jgi:uncharacterized protein YndB with AHSA1/START domain